MMWCHSSGPIAPQRSHRPPAAMMHARRAARSRSSSRRRLGDMRRIPDARRRMAVRFTARPPCQADARRVCTTVARHPPIRRRDHALGGSCRVQTTQKGPGRRQPGHPNGVVCHASTTPASHSGVCGPGLPPGGVFHEGCATLSYHPLARRLGQSPAPARYPSRPRTRPRTRLRTHCRSRRHLHDARCERRQRPLGRRDDHAWPTAPLGPEVGL